MAVMKLKQHELSEEELEGGTDVTRMEKKVGEADDK